MICVSLANITFQECIKALNKAEFAEIRIDQLTLSEDQLKSLFSLKKKTIATCRPEGFDDARRLVLLKLSIDSGAGYIDIEYEANIAYRKELIKYAHANNVIVILSYHNFDKTPSDKALNDIIQQSLKWGADRAKITTMAQTTADCARVMSLYEKHKNLIAFCMGPLGTITRVAAPLLGADFTYAALDSKLATAPGQLTVDGMIDIYDLIK
jgi:3-dehydroquinate dehydratase-1